MVSGTGRKGRRICLVSPGHLATNPRLVKEADALWEAGYHVEVVYGSTFPASRSWASLGDEEIRRSRPWQATAVRLPPRSVSKAIAGSEMRICRALFQLGCRTPRIARRAASQLDRILSRKVLGIKADLYIGHCLAALPVVVDAAKLNGALAGFDAEDYHSGEQSDDAEGRLLNEIARALEDQYLPRIQYFTAAAPLIGEAYGERFGSSPSTILNVFSLESDSDSGVKSHPVAHKGISLYWFSQTIGPGRGLESMLNVAVRLNQPIIVDLRGYCQPGYEALLRSLSNGSQVTLRLLEPADPSSMVRLARGYTAGLALEQSFPLNRDLCLTNKAFTYLLAGVPVIMTPTKAQLRLAKELGDAAMIVDLSDPDDAAKCLNRWLHSEELRKRATAEAVRLGRDRYNWDVEKAKLTEEVGRTLNSNAYVSPQIGSRQLRAIPGQWNSRE